MNESPKQRELRLNHPAAHRARQAHRIIRMREVGWTGDSLVDLPEVEVDPFVHAGTAHNIAQAFDLGTPAASRVARLVSAIHDGFSTDRPGPTDESTSQFLTLDRPDLFRLWDEMTAEAASDLDPEGFKAALESQQRDRAEREALDARMAETGAWAREDFVPHNGSIPWAANALYDLGREGFAAGEIDWDTAAMKVVLVDTGLYTINLATHKFLSSIASGARVVTSAALGSKTVAAGVLDGSDVTYSGLTGSSVELIVIVQSSAVGGGADVADTAQRLILAIDTATGLPFTPSGGDASVIWNNGSNRIAKL